MSAEDLQARFDELGPWFTAYEIDGRNYGGPNTYRGDPRISQFFSWFGTPRTILELGAFEGAHTLQLAEPVGVDRVIGLEARRENLARARLAVELLGRGNIELRQADVEIDLVADHGRFDAVYCGGLLYHLPEPWRLLEQVAHVTSRLYLDTHYAARAEREKDGRAGADFQEGGAEDPLSGLSPTSFWLTLPALIGELNRCGFAVRHLVNHDSWGGHGPRLQLAAITSG